ncbi:MAG: carboxylating nicotinate-nucleotide diphosphorylase [Spirochaetia bacterium]|nr:carboxylating nicotinate-nucleotide diphosphorylase [Spirochaetia bacterium]
MNENEKLIAYGKTINKLKKTDYMPLIKAAFLEDYVENDVTSNSIFNAKEQASAAILAKQKGILSGIQIAADVFKFLDSSLEIKLLLNDSDNLYENLQVMKITGRLSSILNAERTALNFLALLSGISTSVNQISSILKPKGILPVDTRKTIPGYRKLSKYAVCMGGGVNHRLNLSAMGLIKDNHIAKAGSIKEAVLLFRKKNPGLHCEVEVENIKQLKEALTTAPDIIMLDNMTVEKIKESVNMIRKFNKDNSKSIFIEASGGYNEKNIHTLLDTGIDFVSMGSLTQKIDSFDFSLEILK